jgi:hypothetical protein
MKKSIITTITFGALAAGALGLAGAATAVPQGNASAADAIKSFQDQGFNVRINGTVTGPLSKCTVQDVHGLSNSNVDSSGRRIDPTRFDTVTVDVFCPSHD